MRVTERKLKRIIKNIIAESIAESNSSSYVYTQLSSCIEQGLLDAGIIGYPLKDLSYDKEQHVSSAIEKAVNILMSLDGRL
jgi:hypothetical protein